MAPKSLVTPGHQIPRHNLLVCLIIQMLDMKLVALNLQDKCSTTDPTLSLFLLRLFSLAAQAVELASLPSGASFFLLFLCRPG